MTHKCKKNVQLQLTKIGDPKMVDIDLLRVVQGCNTPDICATSLDIPNDLGKEVSHSCEGENDGVV